MGIKVWTLLVFGLFFGVSCHSPATMTAFEAASGKPLTVVTPAASQSGGWYAAGFSVDLSSSTSNAVIRYTTDGTAPSRGTVYRASIPITQNTVLRTQAFKSGFPDSSELTVTYQIGLNPVQVWFTSSTTGIPVQVTGSTTVGQDGKVTLVAAPASFDPTQRDSIPASIYYTSTTDGSLPGPPTAASSLWTSSSTLNLSGNGTVLHVKALGTKDGYTDAQVADVALTVHYVGGAAGQAGGPAVVSIYPLAELYSTDPNIFAAGSYGTADASFQAVVLSNGTDVSGSATYTWGLNGVPLADLVLAQTLEVEGLGTSSPILYSLPLGQYTLSCQIVYGGQTYSGTYVFSVAQE